MTIRSIRDSGVEVDPFGVLPADILNDIYGGDIFSTGAGGNLLIDPKIQMGPGITTVVDGNVVVVPFFANAVDEFNASGSWVTPAGVTRALVLVVAGGAGGGSRGGNDLVQGADVGGPGGLALGIIDVSGTIPATIGAGGSGSDTGTASAGGTSTFSTISATGGSATVSGTGAAGTGSGGDILSGNSRDNWLNLLSTDGTNEFLLLPASAAETLWNDISGNSYTINTDGGTAQNNWTSASSSRPGGGGASETNANTNNASGGIEGTIIVWYYDPSL